MNLNYQKCNLTAAAIFSFNRPLYLKEVLNSLASNTNLDGIDFYLFQDGAINEFSGRTAAAQADIEACLKLWEETPLPNKQVVQSPANRGVGIAQFEAKGLIFNTLCYDRMLFFEDDLVVNRYYLRTLAVMLDQFENQPGVGAVMANGSVPRQFSDEEKKLFLNHIRSGNDQLWGWATWRSRWERIKPDFLDYYRFIKDIDYRKRPDQRIFDFYRSKGFNIRASSQDAAFYYALIKNEMFSINTMLHRAKYIGASGEHMNPHKYERFGFGNTEVLDTTLEASIERFEGLDTDAFLQISHSIFDLK
jgi:hypothetical protein